MSGITRWEVESERPTGLGARYRMLLRVGSAEVGGLIEIVELTNHATSIAWTSVTGVDQRGRWRLRACRSGRTRVELRLAYGVAGAGLGGWLAEQVAAPTSAGTYAARSTSSSGSSKQIRRACGQRRAAPPHAPDGFAAGPGGTHAPAPRNKRRPGAFVLLLQDT